MLMRSGQISDVIYRGDIVELEDALQKYLSSKEHVWLLFDNLDKSWPTRGASSDEILILRSLLEACRKIEDRFGRTNVHFTSIVFIRNDIYDNLVRETPDRGKDPVLSLDWADQQIFKSIIAKRIGYSLNREEGFDSLWRRFFAVHITGEDSFSYILHRTLMRPRDLIGFIQRALQTAVNRGHEKVLEDDIIQAEGSFSDEMLQNIIYEFRDVYPKYPDIFYEFLMEPARLSYNKVREVLTRAAIPAREMDKIIDLLLWFAFLGIEIAPDDERYIFSYGYDLEKLKRLGKKSMVETIYVIHPAFRKSLETT